MLREGSGDLDVLLVAVGVEAPPTPSGLPLPPIGLRVGCANVPLCSGVPVPQPPEVALGSALPLP